MKLIIVFLAVSIITANLYAQTAQTVSINFKGINTSTKHYQVKIDESSYYSNERKGIATVKLSAVPIGKHTLSVYGLKSADPRYNNAKNPLVYTQSFDLRPGYDMDITVRPNGRVLFGEKNSGAINPVVTKTPMVTAKFNSLVQTVKSKFSQALKGEIIKDAFTDTLNYFSTSQVRQLLSLMKNEPDKLDLVMLSYRGVTDAANFRQLSDIFKTPANIQEFNNYLRSNGWTIDDNLTVASRTPMTSANFNLVLQNIKGKWSQSLKGEAANEALQKPNNYFTTAQVRQILQLITAENDRVELAKIAYPVVTDSANFLQVYSLVTTQENKEELNNYLRSKGWKFAGDVTTISVMKDADFNVLVANVRGKWSQALKGETINETFRNGLNRFSTAQVKQLLTLITNENDKLELARMSYPLIVDTLNFRQLYTLFPSQSSKDSLNSFLSEQGWQISTDIQGNVKTPMAETDFNQLVQNIKGNFLQILKVASLKNVLRDPENYFTSSQVYQLVSLINTEENRLDIAKLSYRTVVDKNNFSQVYNLILTTEGKNQLIAHVRDYKE